MSKIRLAGSVLTDDGVITDDEMQIDYVLDVRNPQPMMWIAPRACFVFEILLETFNDAGRFRIGVYQHVAAGDTVRADLRDRSVRRELKVAT